MSNVENIKGLLQEAKTNHEPKIHEIKVGTKDAANILVAPDGMKVHDLKEHLEKYRVTPERKKGTIKLDRVESLVEITKRFKSANSVLFAEASVSDRQISAKIVTIFDYHKQSEDIKDADNGGFRAVYDFPISRMFKKWLDSNNTAMTQENFAYFLEERIAEITTATDEDKKQIVGLKPVWADPIEILELSRDLEIYSNESLVSKNKLSSGEREIKFSSVHSDATGAPITIPDFFVIRVPVFEGGQPQRILVRLRYRKQESTLAWFYDLYKIDEALEVGFEEGCDHVAKEVELPIFYGKPE